MYGIANKRIVLLTVCFSLLNRQAKPIQKNGKQIVSSMDNGPNIKIGDPFTSVSTKKNR